MTNEEFVRRAYAIAEVKDLAAWVACFNREGVFVELALQGTHDGPLRLPQGILPPTGNRIDAPCCDVFRLENTE